MAFQHELTKPSYTRCRRMLGYWRLSRRIFSLTVHGGAGRRGPHWTVSRRESLEAVYCCVGCSCISHQLRTMLAVIRVDTNPDSRHRRKRAIHAHATMAAGTANVIHGMGGRGFGGGASRSVRFTGLWACDKSVWLEGPAGRSLRIMCGLGLELKKA